MSVFRAYPNVLRHLAQFLCGRSLLMLASTSSIVHTTLKGQFWKQMHARDYLHGRQKRVRAAPVRPEPWHIKYSRACKLHQIDLVKSLCVSQLKYALSNAYRVSPDAPLIYSD